MTDAGRDGTRGASAECCPSCGSRGLVPVYEVSDVPVHSVLLHYERGEALSYPRGDIRLVLCGTCGFISNACFDPRLSEYSRRYEGTQSFSPTFGAFNRGLARDLVDRYDLRDRRIVEIGCGQGEFLAVLCELGGNVGVGFDPAYDGRMPLELGSGRAEFVPDFYSESTGDPDADFLVCKMTLEHIHPVSEFLTMVRRSLGSRPTTVFFQVPAAQRILDEAAFQDVYYEHCSYFTRGSLRYAFEAAGFEVEDQWSDFGDQYLMITARPATATAAPGRPEDLDRVIAASASFAGRVRDRSDRLASRLGEAAARGLTVALWGGGSKAVAVLTTLGVTDQVAYVVDVNPNKHGTYLAGTGHRVVGPAHVTDAPPNLVILMNPVYLDEVGAMLADLDVRAEIEAL